VLSGGVSTSAGRRIDDDDFTAFVNGVEPRLRRALVGVRGREAGRDAVAEALAWAWEHWAEMQLMDNPAGYLYRVGVSRTRSRKRPHLRPVEPSSPREVEPGLGPALARLSDRQRAAVVLVHGCDWTYQEVADALGIAKSSVGTHVARGLEQLRTELGAPIHD
jgi:DNA-directed RNA polymerase specialized sigma24 family protein